MIVGLFHPGSGLGNQLHRYIMARGLAKDNGWDYMMLGNFKGAEFMPIERELDAEIPFHIEQPAQKIVAESTMPLWEEKTPYYNPEINYVEDNTIIDGSFEDERYFGHRLEEIKKWLPTERLEMPHDLCVIGFRGGEYYTVPELGLPKEYFDRAIEQMKKINPNMRFEVHTDDPQMAKQFLPDYPIIRDIGINWRSMRYAKYAIIANSSFYILPRLLSGGVTIAPKYWNRYNTKKWDYPQNYYKSFIQI